MVAPKSCRAGARCDARFRFGRQNRGLARQGLRPGLDRRDPQTQNLAERIPDEAETEAGWSGLLGDSQGEATEKVERIRRGMSRLPAGYRAVLSLLLFEGYDYEEAAEITGLKASSVRSQYVRAKARLLEILKKDG